MENEIRLVKEIQSGSAQSLSQFYDQTAPLVLGVITRVVPEPQAAEHLLEEAFWQAWQQSSTFDEQTATPRLWVCAIARRLALNASSNLDACAPTKQ